MSKQRGKRDWRKLVVVISCVLMGAVLLAIGATRSFARTAQLETLTYFMDRPRETSLNMTLETGSVRIHRGGGIGVSITGTKYFGAFGTTSDVWLKVIQSGNTLQINQGGSEGPIHLGWAGIDLDISVPSTVNVNLTMQAGNVALDGIQGRARIKTGSDSITITNSLLTDGTELDAGAGTVFVADTILSGKVGMNSNTGMVAFSGDMDPRGMYTFHSDVGTVSVALPGTTSFIVDKMHSGISSIENEFETAHVGRGPYAHIEIFSGTGPVRLRKSEVSRLYDILNQS